MKYPKINVFIEHEPWKLAKEISVKKIKHVTHTTIMWLYGPEHCHKAELSVLLDSDQALQKLNLDYRKIDKPTNVLSFQDEELDIEGVSSKIKQGQRYYMGDIAISYETIYHEANLYSKSLFERFAHILVHGILHLAGYDHQTPTDMAKMEVAEIAILGNLGVYDPYFIN